MKVLILDNQDSFTYNIVDYLRKLGCTDYVVSTQPSEDQLLFSDKIIFSPGPGLPEDFPLMFEILRKFSASKPILGICLGFQAIVSFYGGHLYRQDFPVHGQSRKVFVVNDSKLFDNCPESFNVGLYHSWAVEKDSIKNPLVITAMSENNVVMGVEHVSLPIFGLQFHPESYISECGLQILKNFLLI